MTLSLYSLWKNVRYTVRVSCLHFEKWDPKCGITEISVAITVAQRAQYD